MKNTYIRFEKNWYRIHMYVVHTIRRIQHVDGDEWQQTDVNGWMSMGRRLWMDVGGQKGPNGWNWMDGR
jgi:hypothetical protein